ncbi:MAG: hypothetical protein K2X32_08290, partial [Phycisphaerales bacterium]|nr:hypothetical protein [Phycisphaerales bacterium]
MTIMLAASIAAFVSLSLTGCMSITPADCDRLTQPPTDRPFAAPVWPARDAEWAQMIASSVRVAENTGTTAADGSRARGGATGAGSGGAGGGVGGGGLRTIVRQSVIRDGSDLIPSVKRSQFMIADATLTDHGVLLEVLPAPAPTSTASRATSATATPNALSTDRPPPPPPPPPPRAPERGARGTPPPPA